MSEFDRATAIGDDGSAEIHDGWDINGNANGGYLMALAANGLRRLARRPDPVTVTAHYLSPGTPGAVQVAGEVVKEGRRFCTVSGHVRRGATTMLQVVGAFGDLAAMGSAYEHVTIGPPELPPFEECPQRPAQQGPGAVGLMNRLDVRLHPDHARFALGAPSGVPEMAGWLGFADGRPIDTLALLLVCDAFPPAVFHLDMPPGWVPTVEYTVHVRGVPAPGPVRCVFRSQVVQGGFLNEDGEVWDSAGRLVAQSRQLGLTPLR